ncbi:MAG: ribbon-helix-helix protein, CopG family [Bradymonadales bacterium]|nr:ribbon-helix-helix protein, CopG family [Bradymonadales bacterium]
MRTTVTLDPDLAEKLKELANSRRLSFKETLNEVLRRGLGAQEGTVSLPEFVLEPHDGVFAPGIDLGKLNQLADDLQVEEFLQETRGGR